MSNYSQLSQEQRYQIYGLMKAGLYQPQIARIIGVHKSTISREMKRNRGLRGYRPKSGPSFGPETAAKKCQDPNFSAHMESGCPSVERRLESEANQRMA